MDQLCERKFRSQTSLKYDYFSGPQRKCVGWSRMDRGQNMLKSCLVVTASSPCLPPQVYLYPDPASGRPSMLYILSISLVVNKAHAEDPLSKTLGTRGALGSRGFHECAHELFWGWSLSLTAHAHPQSPR